MTTTETKVKLVPALERGVKILDMVAAASIAPTVSEIARELSLPKSTVHTICNTLVYQQLLVRRPDQCFQLGPYVMRWANAFTAQSDVVTEFTSIWDRGTDLPRATVTLSVLEGADVVYIATRNSKASVGLVDFRVGMRLPAAFTATGKSFLSYKSDMEVRRLLGHQFPEPLTANSVKNIDELLDELSVVRKQGYSVDNEQVAEGVRCYGACVLDSNNKPMAGIAVSLLAEELSDEEHKKIASNVQVIANQISHRMGAEIDGL